MGGCINLKEYNTRSQQKTVEQADINLFKPLLSSSIFSYESHAKAIVKQLLKQIQQRNSNSSKFTLERIFTASQFKFRALEFHNQCHQKSNTVVIALTKQNRIYGGYTPCTWIKNEQFNYEEDTKSSSFLFCVKDSKLQIYNLKDRQAAKAIMNHEQSGPIFGEGHDLYISDQCNKRESWNNLGKTYESKNLKYGSQKANKQLSGLQRHIIKEYEVWEVKI